MNFQEMNLIPELLRAIEESGYTTPTAIQSTTVPLILEGKDILGCAQTGTGKTAAFALPILQCLTKESPSDIASPKRNIRALVLAPTRELAIQNAETFVELGRHLPLSIATIFGGVNQAKQITALRAGVDILVATPGRLLDLIRQKLLSISNIEIFVLDEADRMLDMGFIHDVKIITSLLPKKKQTLLFSATMPEEVEQLAMTLLVNPETVKVDPVTSTVDKIRQSVYFVERDRKKDLLLYLLKEHGVSSALVFTRTKSNADQVARILSHSDIPCMAIHGNKSQNARQQALNAFKSGKIAVLAATDIAARGIDIAELPFVINYNIPDEEETYIHRIGRTGRAGLGGAAISICSPEELDNWRAIERLTHNIVPTEICPFSIAKTDLPGKHSMPAQATAQRGIRNTGNTHHQERRPDRNRPHKNNNGGSSRKRHFSTKD